MRQLLLYACLLLTLTIDAQAPANDECANAETVIVPFFGASSNFPVDTRTATPSVPFPVCTFTSADDDIWFAFEAVSRGLIISYTNGVLGPGSTGVGYQIQDGCNGTALVCNFSFGNGIAGQENAELSSPLVPGQTYYLRIFAQGTGGGTWNFGLAPFEPNDDCAGADPLSLSPEGSCTYRAIDTRPLSRSSTPPSICTVASNNDDGWYTFQATSQYVELNYQNLVGFNGTTAGLGFSLHDGCNGQELGCDLFFGDGSSGSTIANNSNPLNPGQNYLLRLYVEGNTTAGTFDFCLAESTCRAPLVRYSVVFGECQTPGPQVVATVIDMGGADRVEISNSAGVAPLVFTGPGRDTTAPFPTEGLYTFVAANADRAACSQSENIDVYCQGPNQSCFDALPVAVNPPGDCSDMAEANNWYAGTSEYPLDPSCGAYDGGDLFFRFVAPSEEIRVEVLSSPWSSFNMSFAEYDEDDCESVSEETACASVFGASGTTTVAGFTVGREYAMRVFDRGNNDFGRASFCLQSIAVLPVTFASFGAAAGAKQNELSWATAFEQDLSHFEVQTSHTGSDSWRSIHIKDAMNQEQGSAYQYGHLTDAPLTYYRIVGVDFDGWRTFSGVQPVQRPNHASDATILPNPSLGPLRLSWPAAAPDASLFVHTLNGRLITGRDLPAGSTEAALDLSGHPPGIYVVSLLRAGSPQRWRIVKR